MTTAYPFPDLQPIDPAYILSRIDAELHALRTRKDAPHSSLREIYLVNTLDPTLEWVSTPLRVHETVRVRSFVERVWHLMTTAVWLKPTDVSRSVFKQKQHVDRNAVVDAVDATEDVQHRIYRLETFRQDLLERIRAEQTVLLFFENRIVTARNEIHTWLNATGAIPPRVDYMSLDAYLDQLDIGTTHINIVD